jgi:uncharacterized protein
MSVPLETVSLRERLPDQLRGLALAGIVLVNMPFLAISNAGFDAQTSRTTADRITEFAVVAFAQGKFYLLFSFLFGYSLTLLVRNRTQDGLRRYRRRLIGLAVLGSAHAVLFFVGDILLSYAVLGLALPWFVSRDDGTALRAALACFVVGVVVLFAVVLLTAIDPVGQKGGFVDDAAAVDRAFLGSFADAAAARARALPGVLLVLGVLNWAFALAAFLLGLVAGRRGILRHPGDHPHLWRRLLICAATIGLPAGVTSAVMSTNPDAGALQQTAGVALGFATAPALTGGYIAVVARASGSRALSWMQPAGRMSLTSYLGESILLSAVFCGWGLGLFGHLGAFAAAAAALAVWLALELFAALWLTHFRYGPFEWLLRAWSYGQLPPLRQTRSR